jgi:DNA-binding NarL/FixJ family response regulator
MEDAAPSRLTVAVVDDHILVSEMLALSITKENDLEFAGIAANLNEALDLVHRSSPNVVILNYRAPAGDSIAAATRIIEASPDTRVVLVVGDSEDAARRQRAIDAGVTGLLGRNSSIGDVLHAVRSAGRDELFIRPVNPVDVET